MRETESHTPPREEDDEQPPFGRSWGALYATVLLWLAAQVVIFYAFTEAFR